MNLAFKVVWQQPIPVNTITPAGKLAFDLPLGVLIKKSDAAFMNAEQVETKALMLSGSATEGDMFVVHSDPVPANNGYYEYKNGAYVQTIYPNTLIDAARVQATNAAATDATAKANAAQTAAINAAATDATSKANSAQIAAIATAKAQSDTEFAKVATSISSKNLYNPATKIIDKYIVSTSGLIRNQTGWGIVLIPITGGQQLTLSSNSPRRAGSVFLTDNTLADSSVIAGSYLDAITTAATSVTLTAPVNAKYLCFNLYSTTLAEPTQLQVEFGTVATAYTPYVAPTALVKDTALPGTVVRQSQIPALVAKPYEKIIISKNLFDLNTVVNGSYINNSGVIAATPGWGRSAYIAVTAGQYYTISGTRSRIGLAFYAANTDVTPIAGSYNTSAVMPLTVQAPAGANFLVINLYTSTATTYSSIQVELGTSATAYDPTSGAKTLVDASQIYSATAAANTLTIAGTTATIKSQINGLPVEMSALLTVPATHDKSTVFNFLQDKFNNVVQRDMGDDVAPLRALGTTIGANHGYLKTTITLAGHGKTNADVGSVWSSGSKDWVIVEIISTSQISITARADNTGFVSGTLTHVSGATNTASMTPTAAVNSAFHPVFKNRKLTCSVDGKPIAIADGVTEYRSNVTFNESYDIMLKNDLVEWLITHGGVAVMQYDAEASISLSMNYCFDIDGGCVITSDLLALKAVAAFTDFMLLQAIKMAAGNGTVEYIVPKTKAFVQDSVSYDFSYPTDIVAKNPANDINFNAAKNADGLTPVTRLLQRNDQVIFATGFLPLLDATPAARVTNAPVKYLQIRASSLKVYPALIDGLKTSLNAGNYFCGIGYRKYAQVTTERTSLMAVRHKLGDFLIVDWHQAKTDSVSLPADFAGRAFEIFEKSANVEVLSKVATNRVVFKVSSATPAFAVLLFK